MRRPQKSFVYLMFYLQPLSQTPPQKQQRDLLVLYKSKTGPIFPSLPKMCHILDKGTTRKGTLLYTGS